MSGIGKAIAAGSWPAPLRRVIYLRQVQLLFVSSLPLLLLAAAPSFDTVWWTASWVLLTAMLCACFVYRKLPLWAAPALAITFLSLQFGVQLLSGNGLDALAGACLLSMVLIATATHIFAGTVSLALWVLLLIFVPLLQPTLAWRGLLAINLPLLGVASMLLLFAARLRITLHELHFQYASQAEHLRESEQQLEACQAQNSNLYSRLEQRVEQRTAQLHAANRDLVEANLQLEAFNYMVSHDMRASLRIVDGFAKVLIDDLGQTMPLSARRDLDRIQAAIRHMHGMVIELLKLSKSSNTAIERRRVDFSAMAQEILRDLHMVEPERNVDVDVAEDVGGYAEPALMREVLQNLLTNAWKFTSPRSCARIQFGVVEDSDVRTYYVRDNGVGFDMKRVAELFKPFSRLHDEQDFEGTGVGLVAVKRIVERHGGRVWAIGTPDQGAKLCFTLGELITESVSMQAS